MRSFDQPSSQSSEFSFLLRCASLSTLTLSSNACGRQTNAETLRAIFCNCPSITTLNLSSDVASISDSFLVGAACVSLSTLTLSFNSATYVGPGFLRDCKSLTTVNLSLSGAVMVGHSFLKGCVALSSLTLSLDAATSIGPDFLRNCRSLKTADLSSLVNAISFGSCLLEGCSSLSTLHLSSADGMAFVKRWGETEQPSLLGILKRLPSLSKLRLSYNLQKQLDVDKIKETSV
eukprot:TRINITY_DN22386_c0_g1_i1.p1 TRINITY_DN22386_c0_g1~~TRINITY_DN22386_c0_g1_i1.p1  ORF type:complete len:233 (+),score=30.37 TRINITY_DN22386_c0_g1_i1:253-951(+)